MRRMAVDASITILAAAGQDRLDVRTEVLPLGRWYPGPWAPVLAPREAVSPAALGRSVRATSGIAAGFASTVLMSFSWSAPGLPATSFTPGNVMLRQSSDAASANRLSSGSGEPIKGRRARAKRSLLGPKKTICSISLPMRLYTGGAGR